MCQLCLQGHALFARQAGATYPCPYVVRPLSWLAHLPGACSSRLSRVLLTAAADRQAQLQGCCCRPSSAPASDASLCGAGL